MAVAASGKVTLNFEWRGPSSRQEGSLGKGSEVGVVDLIFQNAKTAISVHIPNNLPADAAKQLPFTCQRDFKETYPESLCVTIEQIEHLTIKAGFFEESPNKGPKIMDFSGKVTQEKSVLRSESEVTLEKPEKLEIGQTYRLVMTSNKNLSLTALLVKEDTQLIRDQKELLDLLNNLLLPLMGGKVVEFGLTLLRVLPSVSQLKINDNVSPEKVIETEINKIQKEPLKELMATVRTIKAASVGKSQKESSAMEKGAAKLCFDLIGSDGLTNIMRSYLKAIAGENIPNDIQDIIDEISEHFKEICTTHTHK